MTFLDKYNQLRKEAEEKEREISQLKKYLAHYKSWYCKREHERCMKREPK